MILYDRDYRILTEEEQVKLDELRKIESENNGFFDSTFFDYLDSLPLAVHFNISLFPNHNYISLSRDKQKTKKTIKLFKKLLDSKVSEREVQNFIKENKAYFLIADPVLLEFSTGNHDSYIFREFELPPSYKADYLVIGKGSGGYSFIFVELESVFGDITIKGGDFGASIRKGINQISDWDGWLESYYSHLKITFEAHKNQNENLASEFYSLDKSRIHYVVIAGRRSDYSEKTYRLRRKIKKDSGISILHYDNLIDTTEYLLSSYTKRRSK